VCCLCEPQIGYLKKAKTTFMSSDAGTMPHKLASNDTSARVDRGSVTKVIRGVENGPDHIKQVAMRSG
jgi:hypothetical protein